MLNKVVKLSSVIVVYELLSDEGKLMKKRQSFNLISDGAADEDIFEIGKAVGDMLAYAPKEILKSNLTQLVEA